jgi:small-conductance mechanosensitive channel
MVRIKVPVGVAYGSDMSLVMRILMECAQDHPMVVSSPAPRALFMGFGESSLDFELRVFTPDIDEKFVLRSELLLEIDEQFRSHGVEIPFPQRDLHLRSADETATLYTAAAK